MYAFSQFRGKSHLGKKHYLFKNEIFFLKDVLYNGLICYCAVGRCQVLT